MPVIALMMFFSALVTQEAQGQCTNPYSGFSNYFSIGPSNRTGIPMTDACVKAGEYLIVDSIVSGKTYFFASSVGTDFLTIHYGSYNGQVLATGTGYIVYDNPYNVGPLYVHINTDASCGTEDVCRAVTAQCISATKNCVVSPWGAWSECSAACGGGTQTRTRSIIQAARNGGAECPALSETRNCNTQPCPIDCVLSDWGPWSECSATCGGGTRTRTRTVLVQAQNGGAPCGALSETEACNTQPCPIDCVLSDWGPWSECSATCGGGTRTRTRTVLVPAQYGGAPCGALSETENCNTQPCPIDCVLSGWSAWSECSVICGGGTRTRARTVLVPAQYGGAPCGALSETENCNTQPCNNQDSDCDGIPDAQDVCSGGDDNGPCNATTFPGINNIPMSWRCGNNNNKVKVCHEGATICVAQNAVQAHLNHGDFLGPCAVCPENRSNAVDNSGIIAGNDIEMELYPNPTDGVLTVQLQGLGAETAQITVLDALGQIVFGQKIAAGTNELQLDFARQNLSSGKYLVRVIGRQGVVTQVVVFNSKD